MIPEQKATIDCICETCFLYHPKKKYCALDGKVHKGCMINYMPIESATQKEI